MLQELTESNVQQFVERFYHCYDGLTRSVKLEFVFEKYGRKYSYPFMEIILEVQDPQTSSGYSVVTLDIEGVLETKVFEGSTSAIALSTGISIKFYEGKIYLAFNQNVTNEVSSFLESDFYIVGTRCFWSSEPCT